MHEDAPYVWPHISQVAKSYPFFWYLTKSCGWKRKLVPCILGWSIYIYICICWETGKWFNLFYKGRLKNILWDRIIVTLQIYSIVGKQFKYILIYVVFPHKKSLSEKWCGKNNHNGSKLHLPHSMALNWGKFPMFGHTFKLKPIIF
jgi:hypothetical protein